MHENLRIGKVGESFAIQYLEHAGYRILDQNWRSQGDVIGELDLVSTDGTFVVFTEVKTTRAQIEYGYERITKSKQRKLRQLVAKYRQTHPTVRGPSRGDVIVIQLYESAQNSGVVDHELFHLESAW